MSIPLPLLRHPTPRPAAAGVLDRHLARRTLSVAGHAATDAAGHHHGEIRLAPADLLRPAEACRPCRCWGCGATRSVREAWATPGTQILAVTVRTGQLPRLFGVSHRM